MSDLTADDFQPHLDKDFRVRGGRHALKLLNIERFDKTGFAEQQNLRAPFNLIFVGPKGDVLPEGHYEFEVGTDVTFPLYVIPIQTFEPGRQDYQAVFT